MARMIGRGSVVTESDEQLVEQERVMSEQALTNDVAMVRTRRSMFSLLAGGALGATAASLGLAEMGEAKKKKKKSSSKKKKNQQAPQSQTQAPQEQAPVTTDPGQSDPTDNQSDPTDIPVEVPPPSEAPTEQELAALDDDASGDAIINISGPMTGISRHTGARGAYIYRYSRGSWELHQRVGINSASQFSFNVASGYYYQIYYYSNTSPYCGMRSFCDGWTPVYGVTAQYARLTVGYHTAQRCYVVC